jgi:hypothetical protein
MLPPVLINSYQRYKEDTDSIAGWLASTAKANGYPQDLLFAEPVHDVKATSGGRLKGKARQQAKNAATSVAPTKTTHIIQIKDFIPLAEYVAGKSVTVPRSFDKTIQRVIAARSGFGVQLEEHGQVLSETSASKHDHFVGGKSDPR